MAAILLLLQLLHAPDQAAHVAVGQCAQICGTWHIVPITVVVVVVATCIIIITRVVVVVVDGDYCGLGRQGAGTAVHG